MGLKMLVLALQECFNEPKVFIYSMNQQQAAPEQAQSKTSYKKQWLIVASLVVGGFVLLNLAIWGAYYNRAYPGVRVGTTHLGNASRVAIRSELGKVTEAYAVTVQVRGQARAVQPGDMGLSYDLESSTTQAVNQGKQYVIPVYGLIDTWRNGAASLVYTVDQEKFTKLATALAGPESTPATDAKVVITGDQVSVEADQPGQGVDYRVLHEQIKKQLLIAGRQVSASEGVTQAKISTKQAEVAAVEARKLLSSRFEIQVNGKNFSPDKVEIGKWLTFAANKDNKLVIVPNNDAINAYVATIAAQVDVPAVTKQINMVNGVVRTVNEGKNGVALDRAALVASLAGGITGKQEVVAAGVMNTVAFKTRTNSTVDLEGKYIEVNLNRQHLWAYDNKQLVYDTPITSGATGAGFATIQGLFSIKAKQTNRNLNGVPLGYDYNVFVQYWMPFSGNYGMHDASWRTSFGGSDYYYGGSHGCVNLPAAAAAWVFNFVNVGTPVWVHS